MSSPTPEPLSRFLPFPEFAEPSRCERSYRIEDSRGPRGAIAAGRVDIGGRVMWVPLEAGGRATSRHELGHVWLSPRRPARVRFDARILAAVEDARVNLALAARGLPVRLDFEARAFVAMLAAQDAKREDYFALTLRAVASLGTSVEREFSALLEEEPHPLAEPILEAVGWVRAELERWRAKSGVPAATYRRGIAIARALAGTLRALGLLDADLVATRSEMTLRCVVHEHSEDDDGHAHGPDLDAVAHGGAGDGVASGALRIATPPLTLALRAGRGLAGWRASNEGSVVRYLHRWTTDRAVFRRRGGASSGTLLVDTSGSMSLEPADLEKLLRATRCGTRVAIYSGRGNEGELRVVAQGGKRAAAEHLKQFGRGNVVDVPALAWLAKQRGPRIWVSDGAVTGVGDMASKVLRARADAICARAQICRVANLDAAVGLLGRAGGAPARA